jgi:hypothetical protein
VIVLLDALVVVKVVVKASLVVLALEVLVTEVLVLLRVAVDVTEVVVSGSPVPTYSKLSL